MRPLLVFLSLVLTVTLAPACASTPSGGAADSDLVFLGQRQVSFAVDHDTIPVTARAGRFRAIQIKTAKSPMEIYDVMVTFGNGQKWSPKTRLHFSKGSWTRRIDLPGGRRVIRKVDFLYRSKRPVTGKAKVGIFGIR